MLHVHALLRINDVSLRIHNIQVRVRGFLYAGEHMGSVRSVSRQCGNSIYGQVPLEISGHGLSAGIGDGQPQRAVRWTITANDTGDPGAGHQIDTITENRRNQPHDWRPVHREKAAQLRYFAIFESIYIKVVVRPCKT